MAAPGKGKRRVKGKTVDLCSFLGDQVAAPGFTVVTPKLDWADYVEEESDDKYTSYRKEEKQLVLPTAPKAARGPDFDVSKIPSEPPFTAYIGNLPFDITEDEIMRFFGNLPVVSVRLPRDGGDRGRMRGFGYAEFENRQSLIDAMSLNGETLKNRPVKVSLAGENENDRSDRKNDGVDRTAGDWRAAAKSDDSFSHRNQRNGTSRFDEPESREPYRGRSSYEDRSRFEGSRQSYQGRRSTERDRDYISDRGYNSRRFGDGGFDKGFDRSSRGDRKDDFEFRRDDRDRGFDRSNRSDHKDDFEFKRDDRGMDKPKDRPRLLLKPRSVPVGEQPTVVAPAQSAIFGGAKPVDTAAKEREIEMRLAKEREKLVDEGSKSKFGAWGEETDGESTVKKIDVKKPPEEPLREKNHSSADDHERPIKERPHFIKSGARLNNAEQENGEPGMRRNFQFRKWHQQKETNSSSIISNLNGGESDLLSKKKNSNSPRNQRDFQKESFLSNKFAHLSSQEE